MISLLLDHVMNSDSNTSNSILIDFNGASNPNLWEHAFQTMLLRISVTTVPYYPVNASLYSVVKYHNGIDTSCKNALVFMGPSICYNFFETLIEEKRKLKVITN